MIIDSNGPAEAVNGRRSEGECVQDFILGNISLLCPLLYDCHKSEIPRLFNLHFLLFAEAKENLLLKKEKLNPHMIKVHLKIIYDVDLMKFS